jgi:hypothetical protein
MRKKVGELIGNLSYEELVDLQRDLFGGGNIFKQVVTNKIKEINEAESRICATCGNDINLGVSNENTLIFGPKDLKKRASFCAVDCLEYFLTQLKTISDKKVHSSNQESST